MFFYIFLVVYIRTYGGGRGDERTGIPEASILASCVEEKTKWPPSFAAVKRLATNVDRLSERPNCMLGLVSMLSRSWMVQVKFRQGRTEIGDAGHVIAWEMRYEIRWSLKKCYVMLR